MKIPSRVRGLEEVRLPDQPLDLAIGMFDGVHLGHQSVIESTVKSARDRGAIAGVLTFWPHPSRLFRPEEPVLQIMNPEVKAAVIRSLGIDLVIEQPFDRQFASLPAEEFVTYLKSHLPTLRAIYVGENWHFGKGRRGDVRLLAQLGREAGIEVASMPRLHRDGEPISSTRLREHLAAGEIEMANALLGFPYFSEGEVVNGRRIGHTLGFPTLNIPWDPELRPRFGVYVVQVSGAAAPAQRGVANYGVRPTVEESPSSAPPLLEVHLLEKECPYGPGDRLRVEWLNFLRPEERFENLEALKAQIAEDVKRAAEAV